MTRYSLLETSFHQAVDYLDLLGRNGITLNPEEVQNVQNTFPNQEFTEPNPAKKATPNQESA